MPPGVQFPITDVLGNRRPYVAAALGNRADISQQAANGGPSRIDQWLWQSYLNLGMSYSFEQAEQSFSGQWTAGMDFLLYPPNGRMWRSIAFYHQNGTAIKINWKDMAYLRRYPVTQASLPIINGIPSVGPPSIVAPFGAKLYVRPYADNNTYSFIGDIWTKPVQQINVSQPSVTPPYVSLGTADIGGTSLFVPDDWLEIIDLGAALRGHVSLLERDKAKEIQELLFGYSVPTSGKQVPGLIATMYNRYQAQAPNVDYNIQPRQTKRSYTNVGA
jgi:hypothetical protein